MIALVTLAEERLAKGRKPAFVSVKLPARPAALADVAADSPWRLQPAG